MKAVCTRKARLNGLQFNPGETYYLEEQVFIEEYKPSIHPQPARGHRIRYIRYKATLPMDVELDDLHGMTEVRTVYFYDRSYCLHHDWKDERGQDAECFDDHFSICEHRHNDTAPTLKKPLWSALPKKINNDVMEVPEDIVEYMKRNWRKQMHKMFGGLSPDDWDYDTMAEIISIPNTGETRLQLEEYDKMRDRIRQLEEENKRLTEVLDHVCDENKVRVRRQIIRVYALTTTPRALGQEEIIEDKMVNMEDITDELDEKLRALEKECQEKCEGLESVNESINKALEQCQRTKIELEQEVDRLKQRG